MIKLGTTDIKNVALGENKYKKAYVGTNAVWEKKPTITITNDGDKEYCYITIDMVGYYTPQTIEVEKGTVITSNTWGLLYVSKGATFVNGSVVKNGYSWQTYDYTVNGDITIRYDIKTNRYGDVYIDEL